jgi:hypothetical protein
MYIFTCPSSSSVLTLFCLPSSIPHSSSCHCSKLPGAA